VTSIAEGASGTVAGIIEAVGAEALEVIDDPLALEFAITLNVYSDPFDNPVTSHEPLVADVVTVQLEPSTAFPLLSYA
jgi:hypothetical protein